jgi:hypothetical protein
MPASTAAGRHFEQKAAKFAKAPQPRLCDLCVLLCKNSSIPAIDFVMAGPFETNYLARMRAMIFMMLAITGLSSASLCAQKPMDHRALGKDVAIVGQLGVPLGTVVEIDATIIAGSSLGRKGLDSEYLLKVSKVGSKSVAQPPICQFHPSPFEKVNLARDDFSLHELKTGRKTGKLSAAQIEALQRGYVGKTYRLIVYEEGVFSGVPANLPENYPVWADRGFGFRSYLMVLRIIPEPKKPNPPVGAKGK